MVRIGGFFDRIGVLWGNFTLDVAFQELEEKGRKAFDDAAKHGNDLAAMHAAQVPSAPLLGGVCELSRLCPCIAGCGAPAQCTCAYARAHARVCGCMHVCTCARPCSQSSSHVHMFFP